MVQSMEVDNTKAIALPILFILALLLAIFITRKTLFNAYPRAKADLRVGILFFGGITTTIMSVFLFPTAAWQYGIISAIFAYMFALSCAPGIIDKRAHQMFVATAAYYSIVLGIPSKWSTGIIASISLCSTWFPVKTSMCSEKWISFAIFIAIAEIIIFFFMLLVLMSFAFDHAIAEAKKKEFNTDGSGRNAEYSAPLAGGNNNGESPQNSARGGGNINIYSAGGASGSPGGQQ